MSDPNPTSSESEDQPLNQVSAWFHEQTDMEARFGAALRQSIDEVLDGQRTGRFDVGSLQKTEKTYLGTKVEIIVRSTFELDDGLSMDYRIMSHEVDAKFTTRSTWTIPREAAGHLCLLMSADDHRSRFRVGLLRIDDDVLTTGPNQDQKRSVSAHGRDSVHWLVENGALPPNRLLSLSPEDRSAVFAASADYTGSGNGGQLRIDELFRRVAFRRTNTGQPKGSLVDRTTVLTVARQEDGPKRARDARLPRRLGSEGIVILGHRREHRAMAEALGVPVPRRGSWVAARLAEPRDGDPRPLIAIGEQDYVLSEETEPAARIVAPY
ncbi:NaeI family type II restriction endonuclease [Streptomyces cacaoi]